MEKTKKGIYYLIFFLVILIISLFIIKSINDKPEKKESILVELQQDNMPIVETKKALNACYAENETTSHYSSIGLFREPSLYDFYWSFKILEETGNIEKFKEDLRKLTVSIEASIIYENERMEVISDIVELQAMLGLDIKRKGEIVEVLNNRFLENEKLFYDGNKNESLKDKIYVTKYAVLIIKYLNLEKDYDIEGIYKVIGNEYLKESYYSNEFNEVIFNTGSAIIDFMYVHKIDLENFNSEVNSRRIEWLKSLNDSYLESVNQSYDFISAMKLINLLKMNRYFENEFIIEEKLIEKYLDNQNFIGGYGPYASNIDPSSTYDMIILCSLNNSDYKNTQSLVAFIEKQINSEFRIIGDLPVFMGDNYYGLLLANTVDFEYNREKAKEFIKLNYLSYIEDDVITFDDFEKMQDIYYILLSCKEMEIDIDDNDKEKLVRDVKSFLNMQKYNEDVYSVLKTFRMGLELSMFCDENLSSEYSNDIEEIIKLTITNNRHQDLLILYEMVKLLEYTGVRNNNYDAIILQAIQDLYCDGGFKLYNHTESVTYIGFLAKGIYIMNYADIMSDDIALEVRKYLNDFTGSKFIFSEEAPIDLRTIYQGYLANKYINDF